MKLKITLPENISDITLKQFQRYSKLISLDNVPEIDFIKRKVEIFTGVSFKDLDNVSQKDFIEMSEQIDKALNEDSKFVDRFTLEGVEFGFIPNFDKITTKEFVDISLYPLEQIENFHKLMAILFRPVDKKDSFGNYSIKNYNGTEQYGELMKRTPMNIVNGALVFFYLLAKELQISTQRYMVQEVAKEQKHQTILQNGDGIQL